MNDLAIVPYEVSHIFAMVSAAKRFSAFVPASQENLEAYSHACELLLQHARRASLHGLRWFHENPRFSGEHRALESKLEHAVVRKGREIKLLRDPSLAEERQVLWRQHQLEGLFRCGVLLTFASLPPDIATLFSVMSSPNVAQGANEALKGAIASAKKRCMQGETSLLIRSGEVEVFAPEPDLRRAFNLANAGAAESAAASGQRPPSHRRLP